MGDLVNMKMSAKEAKEWAQPTATDAPTYPYGLTLSLDEEALAKLGLGELPTVGAKLTVQAVAVVQSTRSNTTQGGEEERYVELQITDMALAPAGESADARNTRAAGKLYGG